jgi:hypothetical protein
MTGWERLGIQAGRGLERGNPTFANRKLRITRRRAATHDVRVNALVTRFRYLRIRSLVLPSNDNCYSA